MRSPVFRIIVLPSILAAAAATIIFYSFFLMPLDTEKLNFAHRMVLDSINTKWEKVDGSAPKDRRALLDYYYLLSLLNPVEQSFAYRLLAIDPENLGFKGGFSSLASPEGLVKIDSVTLEAVAEGKPRQTGIQYYPAAGYKDFEKMMASMQKDIGKRLYIDSGYRSPGRQLFLFFYYLSHEFGYSLKRNATFVAFPGYSEHGNPKNTACDLINAQGISGEEKGQRAEDFIALPEYQWMLHNAGRHNFFLSYPKNNPYGITFEPWHWHWEK